MVASDVKRCVVTRSLEIERDNFDALDHAFDELGAALPVLFVG